jgi:hypothetical protein
MQILVLSVVKFYIDENIEDFVRTDNALLSSDKTATKSII